MCPHVAAGGPERVGNAVDDDGDGVGRSELLELVCDEFVDGGTREKLEHVPGQALQLPTKEA